MLQKIVILATGGTLAGLARDGGGYQAGQVEMAALVQQWGIGGPDWDIESRQLAQIDSKDLQAELWRRLLTEIQTSVSRPDVSGVVVTHGTDTLEETAFLLSALLDTHKPVVLTGAMRPADDPSTDGPGNLADAVRLAASSAVRGVCVVLAGQVHAGSQVQKVHASDLNALSSAPHEPIGQMRPEGYHGLGLATRPSGDWPTLEQVRAKAVWPRVECVLSHAMATPWWWPALRHVPEGAAPVQGLVLMATGAGTWHESLDQALHEAVAAGLRVWVSTRCALSRLPLAPMGQPVAGLHSVPFTPVQARVGLMLSLIREQAS